MKKTYSILLLAICVTSCNRTTKEKIGVVTIGPNEYQVQSNKALEIPPHYNLPIPHQHQQAVDNKEYNANRLSDGEKGLIDEINAR